MTRWAVKLEAAILLTIGAGLAALLLTGNYGRFMNPKYAWVTGTGAILILGMGLAALTAAGQSARLSRLGTFILLFAAIAAGAPWTGDSDLLTRYDLGDMDAPDAWATLDGREYRIVSAPELYLVSRGEDKSLIEGDFVVQGVVKRTPELDRDGHFALVGPFIWCCLADASAMGFRVPFGQADQSQDGQWVEVYGRLKPLRPKLPAPVLKLEMVFYTTVSDEYYLEPDTIRAMPAPNPTYFYQ